MTSSSTLRERQSTESHVLPSTGPVSLSSLAQREIFFFCGRVVEMIAIRMPMDQPMNKSSILLYPSKTREREIYITTPAMGTRMICLMNPAPIYNVRGEGGSYRGIVTILKSILQHSWMRRREGAVATRHRKTLVAHPVEEEDGKGAREEGTLLGWEALPSLLLKLLGSSQGMCPKVSPGYCMLAGGIVFWTWGCKPPGVVRCRTARPIRTC